MSRRPERSRALPPVTLQLEISSIAPGGAGIAHVARDDVRRAVFVPRTAPGEVVEAEVDFSHKPARAHLLRVLVPSPARAEVPCGWAERCGGCALMHLTPGAQLEAHRAIVSSALTRALQAGSSPGAELPPMAVHAAPTAVGYRTRARFAVVSGRGSPQIGYRRAESRRGREHRVVPGPRPSSRRRAPTAEAALRARAGRGRGERGTGRPGATGARGPLGPRFVGPFFWRASGASRTRGMGRRRNGIEGARKPARVGDPRAVTTAADGEPLVVPAGGFAQAHPAMNQKLGERVRALSVPSGATASTGDWVELFAGSGNFTVLLARHTPSLLAVESDPRAVDAARENLRTRGLAARVVLADAGDFELPNGARTVVLDPPRAGAAAVATRLARSKVRRVIYVSCDPATLARDVTTLAASGFQLSAVELFEMFPHTAHVETLVMLERAAGRSLPPLAWESMIPRVDERFRREVAEFDLRCTCESCAAFEPETERCAYGYPTEPHRRLPLADARDFIFCKAFELA